MRIYLYLCLCVAFYVKLLLEHQDAIAPEKTDLLNELLELLEEVPNVESFLGKGVFRLVVFGWLVGWFVGFPILDPKILFNSQVHLKDNRYTSPFLHEGFCT